ncbi:MAG TPA: alanine--tRNA ligase [Candidatus Acidoferrum sp.]|nr:alanine--tRNA ligase [Candidatus Acidoferrum sp.]
MKWMGVNEIREKYLSFFESKGHLRLASASLIPKGDKSLLIINSGMAPLKPYFTGEVTPPRKRVTTCQKCIRTPDIERVGKTARHGTYFEMLGNFSFGDYFKHDACAWAWELCTKVLELPADKLYVTVYLEDDEAWNIWEHEVGVDPSHISRLGKADNFWEIGAGPCGPCSEIYYDRGEKYGCGSPDCAPGCDCDRFVEFWNLVFTQFNNDGENNYTELASKNIDTGMGLERMACIMQGVDNLFETDTISGITTKASEIVGVKYKESPKTDVSLRVITDHIRSTTMMISDGIMPSNEGRGYVLRRLLRRAARHGKLLGYTKPFLYQIVDTVVDLSGEAYPNLIEKREFIKKVMRTEEESFNRTIDAGLELLRDVMSHYKTGDTIPGDEVFRLSDTFGFPVDLTREILEEQGMSYDDARFAQLLKEQQERSRLDRASVDEGWSDVVLAKIEKASKFVGYDKYAMDEKIAFLIKNGEAAETLSEGESGIVVTDETVFYPEGGGEVGDTGTIKGENFELAVTNTTKTADGKILHHVTALSGMASLGDGATLAIDAERRKSVTRNHTSTHLLNMALRQVLGNHVTQAGSLVDEHRIRFDFTHFEAVSKEQLETIESIVNAAIMSGTESSISYMPLTAAQEKGVIADFGEKYGEIVRVVDLPGLTRDLCGGCHLHNTAEAGLFKIVSEGGISAGVRRIEAVTGYGLLAFIGAKDAAITAAATAMKVKPGELVTRAAGMAAELRDAHHALAALQDRVAAMTVESLMGSGKKFGELTLICAVLPDMSMDALKNVGDALKGRIECVTAVLASYEGGKVSFFATASKPAVAMGVHCGNIIKDVAGAAGGKGGGKPDSAQAGGTDKGKMAYALELVEGILKTQIGG